MRARDERRPRRAVRTSTSWSSARPAPARRPWRARSTGCRTAPASPSSRTTRPACPPELAQAEIFGNEKNFPNPPMEARPGLVGEADGSTLYLDEIGELSPEVQAELLRVLDEDGQYRRLGGTRTRHSDFRMIGATNRPAQTPGADFVARFKVRVQVPDLRERAEDIPLARAAPRLELLPARRSPSRSASSRSGPTASRGVRIAPDLRRGADAGRSPDERARARRRRSGRRWGEASGNGCGPPRAARGAAAGARKRSPASFLLPDGRMRELTPDEVTELRGALTAPTGRSAGAAAEMGVSRYQLRRALARYGIAEPPDDDGDDDA